jgi:hypothetical protein
MSLPASADGLFDEDDEARAFARVYLPFFLSGYKAGAENVRIRRRRADFSDLVRERLRKKSLLHATLAVGTTKKQLQKVLKKALDEGWGVEDLGRGIRREFDVMSRVRGLRIARTELTDVINDGSAATLREEGYRQKEWSTVIDGQERPSHHAANGQLTEIGGVFRIGGEAARYPGDETLSPAERVNCRCALVGAGTPDERKRRLGAAFLRSHGALEKRFVVHLRRAFRSQRDRVISRLAP